MAAGEGAGAASDWEVAAGVLRLAPAEDGAEAASAAAAPWTLELPADLEELRLELRVSPTGRGALDLLPAGADPQDGLAGIGVAGSLADDVPATLALPGEEPANGAWWDGYWNRLRMVRTGNTFTVWLNGIQCAEIPVAVDRGRLTLRVRALANDGPELRAIRWRSR